MENKDIQSSVKVGFDNTYRELPEKFFQNCQPDSVPKPKLIRFNKALAATLGLNLEKLSNQELANYFSGNSLFGDSNPIAMAYAGHQFGSFVSQLGDGRALLIGEVVSNQGKRFDIQLKGSGRTMFSRGGDGKSALGPVIREYIISEAMHALGIPTTRALAMVTTGEDVQRQTGNLPGGILTRVASGYVRVGTFEYFYARKDMEALRQLADYVIARHYPEAQESDTPYLKFFQLVCERQAKLVPKWMQVGFIHGVMNTDNTSVCGETIDYGPCAFMDHYNPNKVFSSIDLHGRYSFVNQGSIIAWNLSSLGNCLLPLLSEDTEKAKSYYQQTLEDLQEIFLVHWHQRMNEKLGLATIEQDDVELLKSFMNILQKQKVDYTLGFRYLSENVEQHSFNQRFCDLFSDPVQLEPWLLAWRLRLKREERDSQEIVKLMNNTNPAFIPRNHRVEQAINLAEKDDNFEEVHRLIDILATPYSEQNDFQEYMLPPKPEERVLQTFCGT